MTDENQTPETPTDTPTPTPDTGKTPLGIEIPTGDTPPETPPAGETPPSDSPADPNNGETPPAQLEIPEQFRNKDGGANVEALLAAVTDLRKKVGEGDQTPADPPPENYELNLPKVDGLHIDKSDPLFAAATEFAKEHKISQEQFDGLVKMHVDGIVKDIQAATEADIETMKTRYGENWVDIGNGAIKKLEASLKWQSGDSLHKAIQVLGSSADGMQALIALSNTVGEQTPPPAKDSTVTPAGDTVEALKREMWKPEYQTDPAFRNDIMNRLARLEN